jgi:2-keto-3-deoxy-L-rhamnonate aldolase RhmA
MISVVRVPSLESPFIGVALDAGAGGIVLSHTKTSEQARNLVDLCKPPLEGKRTISLSSVSEIGGKGQVGELPLKMTCIEYLNMVIDKPWLI